MSALGTWMTVVVFVAGTATAAFVCVGVIDWVIDRVTPTQAQKDVDDLFRRDRARDVMRTWVEVDDVDGEPVPIVWQEFDNRPEDDK
jgi:hypothetical protein